MFSLYEGPIPPIPQAPSVPISAEDLPPAPSLSPEMLKDSVSALLECCGITGPDGKIIPAPPHLSPRLDASFIPLPVCGDVPANQERQDSLGTPVLVTAPSQHCGKVALVWQMQDGRRVLGIPDQRPDGSPRIPRQPRKK